MLPFESWEAKPGTKEVFEGLIHPVENMLQNL